MAFEVSLQFLVFYFEAPYVAVSGSDFRCPFAFQGILQDARFQHALLALSLAVGVCGHGAMTFPKPRNSLDGQLAPWSNWASTLRGAARPNARTKSLRPRRCRTHLHGHGSSLCRPLLIRSGAVPASKCLRSGAEDALAEGCLQSVSLVNHRKGTPT